MSCRDWGDVRAAFRKMHGKQMLVHDPLTIEYHVPFILFLSYINLVLSAYSIAYQSLLHTYRDDKCLIIDFRLANLPLLRAGLPRLLPARASTDLQEPAQRLSGIYGGLSCNTVQ